MSKSLGILIENIKPTAVKGSKDTEISGITSDSRQVKPGMLFVAVCGVNVDGHTFISDAVKAGAVAIVADYEVDVPETVAYVTVENSAVALGVIASEWYDNPSRKLKLVGVTGTNGKTTIATLVYEMARLCGYKAGLLSTVVNYIDTEQVAATHTTPDPIELNGLLKRMVDAGCEYAAMEVSSHAAHQQNSRVEICRRSVHQPHS